MNREEYAKWEEDAARALSGRYTPAEIKIVLDWFRSIAEDLLATLNPVLCPSSQDALVEALVTQMSTWQADTPQGPDYVENLLRKLLLEHQNRQKAHHDRNAKQPLAALRCLPGGGDPVLPDTCAAIRA